MRNYEYEYLFKQDSVDKQLTISYSNGAGVLTNTNLEQENFSFNDSLCSQNQLEFGSCESAYIKFKVGYGEDPLEGEILDVTNTPDGGTPLSYGSFTVVEDVPSADRKCRNVLAYDKMHTFLELNLIDWYNSLFPEDTTRITIRQYRDSLFNYLGIEQVLVGADSLLIDTMYISKTIFATTLSGKDVLESLCQANFTFGHITPDGKFAFIKLRTLKETLFPSSHLYPSSSLFPRGAYDEEVGQNGNYINAEYEDYSTAPIDKLQIRLEEGDTGYIVGTGTNAYVIEGNFLLYGKSSDELEYFYGNALDYLSTIYFIPANIVAPGNPCLEVGDRIRLHTRYATIDTYILQRTMSGIQALRDEYISDSPRLRSEQINSVNHELLALNGKTNKITSTIEENKAEMYDIASGLHSEIVDTAGEIYTQIENLQDQIDGNTGYFESDGVPTFSQDPDGTTYANYPAWDFTKSIPVRELQDDPVQLGEGLPFLYTDEYLKEHMRDLDVDLTTGNGYRFVLVNGTWQWNMIPDGNFGILFNQISAVRQDLNSVELEVSNTQLRVADHETRITNNSASISTQATQISAKVNAEDQNGDNSFAWELKKSGFKLKSETKTVFKADAEGVTVKGRIEAGSGYLGRSDGTGFTINSRAISNGKTSLNDTTEGIYLGTNGISLGKNETVEGVTKQYRFKVTPNGELFANYGKIGAFEMYGLNEDGTVGGLSYRDSSGRWGSIIGGVTPTNREGKGLLIDGQHLFIGVTRSVRIYREGSEQDEDIFTFGYDQGHYYINSRWMFGNNNHLELIKNTQINADLTVMGAKNRVVETKDYGKRLLYSLECPSPMFEDIGESQIGENGKVEIPIDPIFAQTIYTLNYQVFLQAYGRGECYVIEREPEYFIVEGTANLHFAWRLVAKQIDMTDRRLEPFEKGE